VWLGPEYQLADDLTRRLRGDADSSVGANIDLYGPQTSKPVRPHSKWNLTRIVVVGDHVEHWLNGRRILEYDFGTDDWNDRVLESKFSRLHPYYGQPKRGKFKLENHIGSRVQYRDISVREL
ncbi:MAG: 3-keto-disaccharide hydrolase, partial [Aeoliella sp.]